MGVELTDKVAREAQPSKRGNRVIYDSEDIGFGLRITPKGAKTWMLRYSCLGQERRIAIGRYPSWDAKAARREARKLRQEADRGDDPLAEREADRAALTVTGLADAFESEHVSGLRKPTQREYSSILTRFIRPELGRKHAKEVCRADVKLLHAKLAKDTPFQANRMLAVLSSMYSFGIDKEWIADNPCGKIKRPAEDKRERFLTADEIGRLFAALEAHPERTSANAVRLLLLTGARKGETLAARWGDFDLEAGVWTKPAATTKTAKLHRVPLSKEALELLRGMRREADAADAKRATHGVEPMAYLFPGSREQPLGDVKHFWAAVCKAAGLNGVRVHDLRHTYASLLASSGLSLPVIGQLLGHTQAATTHRYAHLLDDALREATERAGSAIAKASGNVVPLRRAGGAA